MPSRIESLQALRDLTRGAGVGAAKLKLAELEDLLAVVEAARAINSFEYCTQAVCNDYVWQRHKFRLGDALAKLDEVQP